MNKTALVAAITSLFLLHTKYSQATDIYFRVSYGIADSYSDEFSSDLRRQRGYSGYTFPEEFDESAAYSLNLGYQVTPNISLEGNYSDLASYEDSGSFEWSGQYNPFVVYNGTDSVSAELDSESLGIGFVFSTNISRKYFIGFKGGYQYWTTSWSSKTETEERSVSISPDGDRYPEEVTHYTSSKKFNEDGSNIYYGAIGGWRRKSWHVGLEYTVHDLDRANSTMGALFISKRF